MITATAPNRIYTGGTCIVRVRAAQFPSRDKSAVGLDKMGRSKTSSDPRAKPGPQEGSMSPTM